MRVAIIGAGKAGRALGRLARRAGYAIGPVVCRTRAHAEAAAAFIGAGEPGAEPIGAELTLLAVPDEAIPRVAASLKLPPRAVVAHTCGTHGAAVLRPCRPAGALHPLRSFADPGRAVEAFRGTFCAVDGDPDAVRALEAFVRRIGGRPLRVRSGRKALYHAGAVFASNYVVAVLDAALSLFQRAGLARDEAVEALAGLAGGTVANVRAVGLPDALTGPIERGDAATVGRHLDALRRHAPGLTELYARLGRRTVGIARAKGTLGRSAAGRLQAALAAAEGRR
ncbi:MAG TPA: DUF2520 domain-containing protein [Planctomycetota bacterium]|nr:DUF2520 domain-containing protein [Planctomycetota bacterium]